MLNAGSNANAPREPDRENGISEIHIVSAVATSGEFGILAVKTQMSTSGKLGHHFSGNKRLTRS